MRCRASQSRPLFRSSLPLLALAVVAGCVAPPKGSAPPPAPPPVAIVVPPPPPPAAPDWRDRPFSPGDWHRVADAAHPAAEYRTGDGTAIVTLRCDRAARTVAILLAGQPAPLTIRTTSTVRTLAAPTLAAADPLLDAMAFSRGRFSVEQPGRAPLTLPAWAEVGRLVEDCRA
jgi:hypothetical protein